MLRDLIAIPLLVAGALFFLAGTVALLRFPDVHARLHGLSKADNLGLGCIVAGLAIRADAPAVVLKLALIWLVALVGSATGSYLIARLGSRSGSVRGPAGTDA